MTRNVAPDTDGSQVVVWALAALVVLVPYVYWPDLRDYTLPPKLLVMQLVVLLCLVIRAARPPASLRLSALGLPALAYLLVNALSVSHAIDRTAALLELTKILSGCLLFALVAVGFHLRDLPRLLAPWAAAALGVSLIGIGQYHGWQPFDIPSAGLPSATLGYRNIAAMYLIQSIPICIGLFLIARSKRDEALGACATALLIVFLAYTRTRGAWVGLIGGLVITAALLAATRGCPDRAVLGSGIRRPLAIAAAILVLALSFLPSSLPKMGPQSIDEKKADVDTALASILRGGGRGRLTMWKHTVGMVQDHPVLGVGLGNWSVHYPRYDRGDRVTFSSAPERPHNDPLWILSEVGLLGLLCYLWLAIAALRIALRCLRSPDARVRWMGAACLAGIVAIVGHSLFSFPRERVTPTVFFWLSLGLLAALDPSPRQLVVKRSAVRALLGVSIAIALAQLAFTLRVFRFESHMHRAVVAERRQDWREVARETALAAESGAMHTEAIHLGGYALNQMGDFASSAKLYRSALDRRPYDIQLLNGAAIAAQGLGQPDQALIYYGRALDIVPDLPDIYFNVGDLHRRAGRTSAALDAYRRAVELRPDDAQAYFALGELLTSQGDLEKAVAAYEAFLENWKGAPRYAEAARSRIAELSSRDPQ